MYAVTESASMQQDNISYDNSVFYLILWSLFYEQNVILQSITYKV